MLTLNALLGAARFDSGPHYHAERPWTQPSLPLQRKRQLLTSAAPVEIFEQVLDEVDEVILTVRSS